MSNMSKILHWIAFLTFLIVLGTAIMNTTFYSKESIIDTFSFSFPTIDLYNIGHGDKITIARMERRVGWVWHFFAGTALFLIIFIKSFLYLRKDKELVTNYSKTLMSLNLALIGILFISGVPLYVRETIFIPQHVQDIFRVIHYYTSYGYGFFILSHIILVIYRENKFSNNSISNMLKFNGKFLSLIFLSTFIFSQNNAYAASSEVSINHYEIAMAFYTGKKGASIKVKNLPNCPYDFCKNADLMKKKFGIKEVNGSKTIKIVEPDIKKALFFFQKAAYEDNNINALVKAIKIMLSEINYKDTYIDPYLLKNLKKNTGYENIEDYKISLKNLLDLAKSKKTSNCFLNFKIAEFYEKGYLNLFKIDRQKSIFYYGISDEVCKEGRFEKMIASSKIKI